MSARQGYLRRSRSIRLVEELIASERHDVGELASAIGVTGEMLESYRSGRLRMPLERQLCLARLTLELWPHPPRVRRYAYALRGQVLAEMAFRNRLTSTHGIRKVPSWESRR